MRGHGLFARHSPQFKNEWERVKVDRSWCTLDVANVLSCSLKVICGSAMGWIPSRRLNPKMLKSGLEG